MILCFLSRKSEIFTYDTTIYSWYIHGIYLNYEEAHRKLSNNTHIVPNWF